MEVEKRVDELVVGDLLLEDVFINTKQPIVRAETYLTPGHIVLLEQFQVETVLVQTEQQEVDTTATTEEVRPVEKEEESTKEQTSFERQYEETFQTVQSIFYNYRSGSKLQVSNLRQTLLLLREQYVEERPNLLELMEYMDESYYWEHKAILVGLLSAAIGEQLGYKEADLNQLCLAGAVSDVGMLRYESRLLEKRGALSEFEKNEIQEHVEKSVRAIADSVLIRDDMKRGVAEHHERLDGSGYPRQIRFKACSEIGQILAVSDVFVALSSRRPYREAYNPHEALAELRQNGLGILRLNVIRALEKVADQLEVGMRVRLTNGAVGIIQEVPKEKRLRPVIELLPSRTRFDLLKEKEVWIDKVISTQRNG